MIKMSHKVVLVLMFGRTSILIELYIVLNKGPSFLASLPTFMVMVYFFFYDGNLTGLRGNIAVV